jgi:hypothetical protein
MGKEINLGSNVYKLKDNQICKFMVVKRITTETLEGETISFIIKDDHDNEFERTLSELENNYFSTPREVTDYLLSEYKESIKISNSVRKINLDLYETDGYTDKHRDYVSVPMQYIKKVQIIVYNLQKKVRSGLKRMFLQHLIMEVIIDLGEYRKKK